MAIVLLPADVVRRSKYRNARTTVDGETFDSGREARRWVALVLLLRAGRIKDLRRQVPFVLCAPRPHDVPLAIGSYVADFVYAQRSYTTPPRWQLHVEDAKGIRTALYKWKRKHFEAQYAIMIEEV